MNSTGTPNSQAAGPFGYAFSFPPEGISEPQELPVPGPSLLNTNEDDFINNFFLTQSQLDPSVTNFNHQSAQGQGHDHGQATDLASFGWLMNEPPPTFMGAAATPKLPPSPSAHTFHALPSSSNFDFSTFSDNNDLLGNASHDDLLTASILNNSMGSQPHAPPIPTPSLISAPSSMGSVEMIHTTENFPVTTSASAYLPQQTPVSAQEQPGVGMRSLGNLDPLNTVQDVNLDGPHTAPARMDEPTDTRLYRFGSDNHFQANGFIPLSENETEEVISHRLTSELYRLKPINRSNNNTRAPTPEPKPSQKRSSTHLPQDEDSEDDEDDHESRPKKRRKDESEESYGASAKTGVIRKSSQNPRLRRVSSVETGTKRRRSSVTGAKPSRENLTEEQKRSNHIQSEQKRRNLIKQGFDELHILVPELRAGGLSKSMVLSESANFLELLINCNNEARRRFSTLKGN